MAKASPAAGLGLAARVDLAARGSPAAGRSLAAAGAGLTATAGFNLSALEAISVFATCSGVPGSAVFFGSLGTVCSATRRAKGLQRELWVDVGSSVLSELRA